MAFVGIYDNATTYQIGDQVSYLGGLYTASQITTGNLPSDSAFWNVDSALPDTPANELPEKTTIAVDDDKVILIDSEDANKVKLMSQSNFRGEKGDTGDAGISIMWKGTYSGATTYIENDAVSYNGSSYICIAETTGNLPTDTGFWGILAEGSGINAFLDLIDVDESTYAGQGGKSVVVKTDETGLYFVEGAEAGQAITGTWTPDGIITDFDLPSTPLTQSLSIFRNGQRQKEGEDYNLSSLTVSFLFTPGVDESLVYTYFTTINIDTGLNEYLKVNNTPGDEGVDCIGEWHVGTPGEPKESTFGGGDSYAAGINGSKIFHCKFSNTSNTTITGADDVTAILGSNTGSTTGLFGGTTFDDYLLIGSDYVFQGAKITTAVAGVYDSQNVFADVQRSANNWTNSSFMAIEANFPYERRGWNIGKEIGAEQIRFGFDPTAPFDWVKVDMVIDGITYNKYWARMKLTSNITSDIILEQVKISVSRTEVNADGTVEFFDFARPKRTLLSGINNLVNNAISSPQNEAVDYTDTIIANYVDNEFVNGANDSKCFVINIDEGLDTSIPLEVKLSYYVKGTATGNIKWDLEKVVVGDGFVYDGDAEIDETFTALDQVTTDSNLIRRSISITADIREGLSNNAFLFSIRRDATASNPTDTLGANVIITHIIVNGYTWKPS